MDCSAGSVSAARLLELHSWDEICRNAIDRGACAHFAALDGATVDSDVIVGVDYVDEWAVSRGVSDGAVVIIYEWNHMTRIIPQSSFVPEYESAYERVCRILQPSP